MHMNADTIFVDKIVDEVKSQGIFDQFRKDSMADVDTKPAYQNLRQRVETTVGKFLGEQEWSPDLSKNQLRERLRKYITECGFLDLGVERIVDQVVNPKISTVFQPKIEDIAYKFLGIEKPQHEIQIEEKHSNLSNGSLNVKTDFMPTDLEAVSPDSDKMTNKSESKEDLNDLDDKNEEFESPPFEPLEGGLSSSDKKEDSNESQLSGISGLTSQDSVASTPDINTTSQIDISQESELSQVSSNSRLSIVTNEEDYAKVQIKTEPTVGISEEAQMPKFSDNAYSETSKSEEPLHFDIKRDEIKFEGTDRKGEKSEYFANAEEIIVHTFFQDANKQTECDESNSESKILSKNEASASSNLTYSTDTQASVCSKGIDVEKDREREESKSSSLSRKDNFHFPKLSKSENSEDKQLMQKSVLKDHSSSDKKHNSKSSKENEKQKELRTDTETSENGSRNCESHNSSHSSQSSSRRHKSCSQHNESKSNLHKNECSKEKSDKYKEEKHHKRSKHSKDKNKSDDHFSARKKNHRRKSTDSNDDSNASKEGSKNNSLLSLEKDKETTNNSNSSANFATNTDGSVDAGGTTVNNCEKTASQINTYCNNLRPTILDSVLVDSNWKNIELIIGAKIQINENPVSITHNDVPSSEDEEELMFFESNSKEKEQIDKILNILTKDVSKVYVANCDEEYKFILHNMGFNVVTYSNAETEGSSVGEQNRVNNNNVEYNEMKDMSKFSNILTKGFPKQNANVETLRGIIPNGKRKRSEELYKNPYHIFADEKMRSTAQTLIIDCLDYSTGDKINKKLKLTIQKDHSAKVSPTPSDLSVGSKENEFTEKHTSGKLGKTEKKQSNGIKTNQRYSSEDLYKPRPVLSQRSRRRAMDSEII